VVGCDLQVTGLEETVQMVREAGGEMVAQTPVDLSVELQVESWMEFAISHFGDFDILYNNDSAPRFAPVDLMTVEDWDFTLDNEFTLVFLAVKHAIPVLAREGGSCILNTASISGMGSNMPGGFAYSATKAQISRTTRCRAVQVGSCLAEVSGIDRSGLAFPQLSMAV
jgi:NAD(P)-dependent dehydrogenase (short-subunit alcohol dehydrogenase family)